MSNTSGSTKEKVPLWDFWNKHAMPPMLCPSCLVCGQQTPPERAAITHMELPAIVVCFTCRDRAALPSEPEADLLDYKLPCEVRLPPATTFGVGVSLRTVVHAMKRRTDQYPPKFPDSPDLSGVKSPFQRLTNPTAPTKPACNICGSPLGSNDDRLHNLCRAHAQTKATFVNQGMVSAVQQPETKGAGDAK